MMASLYLEMTEGDFKMKVLLTRATPSNLEMAKILQNQKERFYVYQKVNERYFRLDEYAEKELLNMYIYLTKKDYGLITNKIGSFVFWEQFDRTDKKLIEAFEKGIITRKNPYARLDDDDYEIKQIPENSDILIIDVFYDEGGKCGEVLYYSKSEIHKVR